MIIYYIKLIIAHINSFTIYEGITASIFNNIRTYAE